MLSRLLGFTRHSYYLFSAFLLTCFLIAYIWWPLVEEYLSYIDGRLPWYYYVDWLLLGIFTFMSLTIMSRADLRTDALIVFVGMCGGLVIESWGTQTNLWHYYTAERPPLWIIPAWPIASLSIDRVTRLLKWISEWLQERFRARSMRRSGLNGDFHSPDQPHLTGAALPLEASTAGKTRPAAAYRFIYWIIFPAFYALMLSFVAPTFDKSLTLAALALCLFLILTPTDHRMAVLTFLAGSALGYFLERWGTTRECWTYYTFQTPPVFAVFAHGLAAVAFWRAGLLLTLVLGRINLPFTTSKASRS